VKTRRRKQIVWTCKRTPGQHIEIEILGYTNVVKLSKVIAGKYAWVTINGDMHGPLAAGAGVVITSDPAVLITITRFKGQTVTFGLRAPEDVKLRAGEKPTKKEKKIGS
jgi:hypothetical protein